MLAKAFGVSQFFYAMQSFAINPNDSKVSEKAFFSLVEGHTNSNGREMKACKTTLSI